MSRSRKVSRRRRTLPASETWSAAGWARSASTTASDGRQPVAEQRPRGRLRLRALLQRLQDVLLDLRPEPGQRPQALLLGRVAQTRRRVVTPSSSQIRRAVFGPRPGSRMNATTSAGIRASPLGHRLDLARLDDLDDLLLDRLADALQLLRLPVEGELRDRAAGLADPLRGAAVRQHTKRLRRPRARACRRAVRAARPPLRSRGSATAAIIGTVHKTTSASPRTTSARTSSRWSPRCSSGSGLTTRVLVIDDGSPDGTGELADRAGGTRAAGGRAPPRDEGGPRPGVPRRDSSARSPTAPSSCSRWTATSPTTRTTFRA